MMNNYNEVLLRKVIDDCNETQAMMLMKEAEEARNNPCFCVSEDDVTAFVRKIDGAKKRIRMKTVFLAAAIIILAVVVTVSTVSAIESFMEERTTFLVKENITDEELSDVYESASDVNKNSSVGFTQNPPVISQPKDIAPDAWMKEYYIDLKTMYTKTGNEKADSLVDALYAKIDEFYEKIKHGITEKEYTSAKKEIYSIIAEIDAVLSSTGEKKPDRNASYNYADAKMKEIREELDQYIMEWEWIKYNEKNGNSPRTRAKLKKAYELDKELKVEEKKLKNREYTIDEANTLVTELYEKFQAVSSNVGTAKTQ